MVLWVGGAVVGAVGEAVGWAFGRLVWSSVGRGGVGVGASAVVGVVEDLALLIE